ncbi:hypothetical protein [Sporosarcina sp. Te-1]|uniref:hypothetical protein n=1 Tax=Sporosarcina sp. Te-1 TaxID=2818390 RepID=UPI001A9D0244|nr:hypothetical protein [Sporosarcina sp. Te-1]QTD42522.1 hypothetical protein J3U78_06855 [Sporosarcina sp. Te-1]
MKRIKKFFFLLTAMALMLSTGIATHAKDTQTNYSQDQFNASISQSLYYDKGSGKVQIDENRVAELQNISLKEAQALKEANEALSDLSKEETDKMLIDAGYDPENLEDGAYLPNAWPIFLIGIGLIVAYYFWDRYLSYKEKTLLINRCYDQYGYPVVDSRDNSGLRGIPNEAEASRVGGFNFACMQNP